MKILMRLKKSASLTYPIYVGSGLFKKIPDLLKKDGLCKKAILITDDNVKKLFGKELLDNFKKSGIKSALISIPAGESSKCWGTISGICGKMAEIKAKRDSCVIALGGGVVGDIAGFAASIYMRGIPFVQIPTTLLGMIDSSVGGKTGIDLQQGKNLVGTFYHPKIIIIDPELIKNLPHKELQSGYAEIIKHAVIASKKMFLDIAKNLSKIASPAFLERIIAQNIKIKAKIVQSDEDENIAAKSHSRMVLNYGHTIGHAIEKLENYTIPHGQAISIGMVLENRMAVNKKILKEKEALMIKNLLSALGLRTKLPDHISFKAIEKAVLADKKIIGGKLMFALPRRIGKVEVVAI